MGMGHATATLYGAEVVKYEIWDTAGQERYKSLVLGAQEGMTVDEFMGTCWKL